MVVQKGRRKDCERKEATVLCIPPKILWLFFCLRGTLVSHNSPWNTDFFLSFFTGLAPGWASMRQQQPPRFVRWQTCLKCVGFKKKIYISFPSVNLSSLSEGWVAMAWGKCGLNGFNERRESLVLIFLCLNNGVQTRYCACLIDSEPNWHVAWFIYFISWLASFGFILWVYYWRLLNILFNTVHICSFSFLFLKSF